MDSPNNFHTVNKPKHPFKYIFGFTGFLLISLFALVTYWNILLSNGEVPWGSDTLGHVYRFDYLLDSFKKGVYYPSVYPEWYLGIQLLRYYPPLIYYALAFASYIISDPGTYQFSVSGIDQDGNPVEASGRTSGVITGITFENGYPELLIGDRRISLGDVVEII